MSGNNGKDGRFTDGNDAAAGNTGGKRGRSGRKSNAVKQALNDLLTEPMNTDPNGRSLVTKARDVINKALDSKNEQVALDAAKNVWDRHFGKPKQAMDVIVASNDEELIEDLDNDEDLLRTETAAISAMADAKDDE